MIRVGVVVQRYGKDIVGGAETLSRDVAERLNASGCDVTVFTTTAKDYVTWRNEFNVGESILKGVRILRYDVEHEREINSFNEISGQFFQRKAEDRSTDDETDWIKRQGPYCPALIEALKTEEKNIDVFLFFTYLYYPTIEGLKAVSKPAVLFPTAHDEAPIYLKLMEDVFKRPDALFFLTGAEMDFVKKKFNPPHHLELIRTGTEMADNVDENLFRRNYIQVVPYFMYAGRIEAGKGLEPVFEAYRRLREQRLVQLVLMGKKLMDIPDIEGIKYVGFVSEEEKLSAFKGALFAVQPSALESLSITTLEAFSQKTPVLVNKKSHVLCEHIDISGGGLAYDNVDEFIQHAVTLMDKRKNNKQMGQKGYDYVKEYFSWDVVIEKIKTNLHILVNEHKRNRTGASEGKE